MTALRDIEFAISTALKPQLILVGCSAERAIVAELRIRDDENAEIPETIGGLDVHRTHAFKGWELVDE